MVRSLCCHGRCQVQLNDTLSCYIKFTGKSTKIFVILKFLDGMNVIIFKSGLLDAGPVSQSQLRILRLDYTPCGKRVSSTFYKCIVMLLLCYKGKVCSLSTTFSFNCEVAWEDLGCMMLWTQRWNLLYFYLPISRKEQIFIIPVMCNHTGR